MRPRCAFPAGLARQLSYPNGAVLTNAFDGLGRLTTSHLRTSGGTLISRHDYAYDRASQRTNQVRLDGSDVSYHYDGLGQLKTALGRHGPTGILCAS